MNKLNEILAKLTGKTLAEQVGILTAELKGLFANADESAKTITPADLAALSAKLDTLKADLATENATLRADAATAKVAQTKAETETATLRDAVAQQPAFAQAAAGHNGAAPGGGTSDGAVVVGTMVDQFCALKTKRVNGGNVNGITAEAVRFFEKNADAMVAAGHANHPMLARLMPDNHNPGMIKAALTSTGTTTTGTGLAFTMVAIKTIKQYGAFLLPFKAFTTDFSLEALVGTTVKSRVVPLSAGAGDLNDTYSGDYFAAAKTLAPTEISIDMTPHPIDGFSITPDQFSNIALGVWPETAQKAMQQKMYSVATYCLKKLYDIITAANFGQIGSATLPANVDNQFVGNLGTLLKPLGFQPGLMSLVLGSPAYGALGNDPLISNYMASQMNTLRDGIVPTVRGFNLFESPSLPYASTTPATEKLIGFANMPGGLCVAMRPGPMPPNAQLVPGLIMVENIEDPVTGAILTISQQIDPATRQLIFNVENRFGSAKGDGTQLLRIVSP